MPSNISGYVFSLPMEILPYCLTEELGGWASLPPFSMEAFIYLVISDNIHLFT